MPFSHNSTSFFFYDQEYPFRKPPTAQIFHFGFQIPTLETLLKVWSLSSCVITTAPTVFYPLHSTALQQATNSLHVGYEVLLHFQSSTALESCNHVFFLNPSCDIHLVFLLLNPLYLRDLKTRKDPPPQGSHLLCPHSLLNFIQTNAIQI